MRLSRSGKGLFFLVCALASRILIAQTPLHATIAEAGQGRFLYRGPGSLEFEVTSEGLSAIRLGGRALALGGWHAFNAEEWFKDSGTLKVATGPVMRKSLEIISEHHVRVTHSGGHVVATTDYSFDGEDVTVSARIENNHPDEPINVLGFSGLTFDFDRPPQGIMQVQHISYFQSHGLSLCHPSFWSRIGGSYATDNTIGVGVSPWKTGLTRTLILWDYSSWESSQREKSSKRNLIYFVASPVPARGAATFEMRLRVSSKRDWQHLLTPYREHFQATFGAVRYDADNRWIASEYVNHGPEAVSPTNRYGFHDAHRRLDLAEGVDAFCQKVIPELTAAGGQGVILWGQGGNDPRGAMYRPDFDILPPEVEQDWPILARRLKEAGLKLGVTARPGDLAVKLDWQQDQIISINPEDPGHLAMVWKRFQKMIERGCTLFYLDSFGAELEHVKLMRFLRERMGRKILCFAEQQCDALMPYSGGYSETTFHNDDRTGPSYRVWSEVETWKVFQWLAPGCQLISRFYQVESVIPRDFENVDHFFYRHRITPLVPLFDFRRLPELKGMQTVYVDSVGKWKDTAR